MIVRDERLDVPVSDGVVDARLLLPDGDGPFPLVLFLHDAGGLRPAMTTMAGRLVERGYAVVQPNLYRRCPPFPPFDFKTVWTVPAERARIKVLMDSFTPEQAMADLRAMLQHLDADRRVRAGQIGCVGYCMGGRQTLYAAAHLNDRVVAGASIHGGGLVTPAANSPHLGAPSIGARMYFGVAAKDNSCTAEAAGTLLSALMTAGVQVQVEFEAKVLHGYAVPDFPVYDPDAAERHWQRLFELFDATLAGT